MTDDSRASLSEGKKSPKPTVPERPAAPRRPRAAPIHCHECGKRVLLSDRVAIGTLSVHRECLFCARCGKELTPEACHVVRGQIYCETHRDTEPDVDEVNSKVPVGKTTSSKQHKRLQRAGGSSSHGAAKSEASLSLSCGSDATPITPGNPSASTPTVSSPAPPPLKTPNPCSAVSIQPFVSTIEADVEDIIQARPAKNPATKLARKQEEDCKSAQTCPPVRPAMSSENLLRHREEKAATHSAANNGRKSPIYGPRKEGCSMPSRESRLLVGVKIEPLEVKDVPAVSSSEQSMAKNMEDKETISDTAKPAMTGETGKEESLKSSTKPPSRSALPPKPARSSKPPAPARPGTLPKSDTLQYSKPEKQPSKSDTLQDGKSAKRKAPKPPSCPAPPPPPPPPTDTSAITVKCKTTEAGQGAAAQSGTESASSQKTVVAGNTKSENAVGSSSSVANSRSQAVEYATTKNYGKKRMPTPKTGHYQATSTVTVPKQTSNATRPTALPIQGITPGAKSQTKPSRNAPRPALVTAAGSSVDKKASENPPVDRSTKPDRVPPSEMEIPYHETNITCWPMRSRSSHVDGRKRNPRKTSSSATGRSRQEEIIYQTQKRRAPSIPKNVQRWLGARVVRDEAYSLSEIEDKLKQLSNQQRSLELEGQRLDEKLRNGNPNEEKLMKDWLHLVEEKNALVYKESELVYMQQDLQLVKRRDDLEAEIHRRMEIDASRKSKRQISEEEGLILQLVETVNARNRLVNMLDLERLI